MKPLNKFVACVGSLGLLALGSSSASALSTWNFKGDGGNLGFSEEFISNDGFALNVTAYTLLSSTPDPDAPLTPNTIFQANGNNGGIGVGLGNADGQLDALPNASFFGFELGGTAILDVLRLEVGGDGWFAKEIMITRFNDPETVQLFGSDNADGSGAVLLNELVGVSGNPDVFALDDSVAFDFFFIAAVATPGSCDLFGFCGDVTSLRISAFTGQQVPEPAALALLGAGLVGMVMVRRRRKIAA